MKFNPFITLVFFFSAATGLLGQQIIEENFQWEDSPVLVNEAGKDIEIWRFNEGGNPIELGYLPTYATRFPIAYNGIVDVNVLEVEYEDFSFEKPQNENDISSDLYFYTKTVKDRNQYSAYIRFIPIIKTGNRYQRVKHIKFSTTIRQNTSPSPFRGPDGTTVSVLSDGEIYKIAVTENGIHKLTYDFLKNSLGISNLDNIDPRNIKLYGNGGGMLPEYTEAERIDDLEENAIYIEGENDGVFNSGDYILFYGEGADEWKFDTENGIFNLQKNYYSAQNYYYIKISPGNGNRVTTQNNINSTDYISTSFNDFARYEEDLSNLLADWERAEGSGKRWFGDHFNTQRSRSYNGIFSFENITSDPVHLRADLAIRANRPSSFNLTINNQNFTSEAANAVTVISGTGDTQRSYYHTSKLEKTLNLSDETINIEIEYPWPSGASHSEAWLDYIQLNVRRELRVTGNQMDFRDIQSLDYSSTMYQVSGWNNNYRIWDISNPLQPKVQEVVNNGGSAQFGANSDELKTFIAFNPSSTLLNAEAIGQLANQNVHGISSAEMVIIYHEDFETEAMRLAKHRNQHDNLNVAIVPISQIYNEFSSGKQDPSAIRDFCKMLYERSPDFKYLLLFGDASYDFRNISNFGNNYVATYERDSANPLYSFPTDDYFGILYHTSSNDPFDEAAPLNIAIGRLPVNNPSFATAIVDKLIHYDIGESVNADWRTRFLFVADDEDSGRHELDADGIADIVLDDHPRYNVNKLYLDAFEQVSTGAADRAPALTEAINQDIFKGIVAVVYLGHGGIKGWAQERILNISDILNWRNFDKTPVFITATCSFTAFDDPTFTSAGEETFINSKGGAINMLTTTRAVYAHQNRRLTETTVEQMLIREDNGRPRRLGDIMRIGKNLELSTGLNTRKFVMIGDPAQRISLPQYDVLTTKINGSAIDTMSADTIRALEEIVIEGIIADENGAILDDFNGIIYPTIYDKRKTYTTLGQDGTPIIDYNLQKSILFKGRASVTSGKFQFNCIIPKDINYEYGEGKISYYATEYNNERDAAGYSKDIVIGGTSDTAINDDEGPQVEVYMNTEDFVSGGITNSTPTLLVKLEDDYGINVVGNSIGHDLEGILDEDVQNTFVLNDFYEAELDDFTKGVVQYPMSELEVGRHRIVVSAWDVANNRGEGSTEFVVASSANVALEHVLNYPNPFTDRTCFQFDHNMAGESMDVMIQVFTVSGRLVKTLRREMVSDGSIRKDDCIEWDGRDDYGDKIGRGVYLYKVKVRSGDTNNTVEGESDYEKLVILK